VHVFDVQAHRGLWREHAENTLGAFAAALSVGVTTIELDVGVTHDGVVIVSHERRVSALEYRENEWIGTPWKDLALAEARALERHDGSRVATLMEVLALVADYPAVRLAIDAKSHPSYPETVAPFVFAARIATTVAAAGMTSRCSVRSVDWRLLVASKQLLPQLETVALVRAAAGEAINPAVVAQTAAIGASALAPQAPGLTPELVTAAHAAGLSVIPWTVNARSDMERLVESGVNGLTTDDPGLLRDVLAARGARLPAVMPLAA
jgi:glycerophosphoryl diester phosphodiesterase